MYFELFVSLRMFRGVPLSSDPEKAARQIANLRRGPAAAAKNHGLPVVGYDEPAAAPAKPKPAAKAKTPTTTETAVVEPAEASEGGISTFVVLAGGAAVIALLILLMSRGGPKP